MCVWNRWDSWGCLLKTSKIRGVFCGFDSLGLSLQVKILNDFNRGSERELEYTFRFLRAEREWERNEKYSKNVKYRVPQTAKFKKKKREVFSYLKSAFSFFWTVIFTDLVSVFVWILTGICPEVFRNVRKLWQMEKDGHLFTNFMKTLLASQQGFVARPVQLKFM